MTYSNQRSPYANQWPLDPTIDFLNHGSFGACPKAILQRQQELRNAMESEPVRFMECEYPALLDVSRRKLAAFTGCRPEQLVFVRNVTEAVNAVIRSYPFEKDDEILATDHEYNACANVARFMAEHPSPSQNRVRFVEATVPYPVESSDDIYNAVMARVTDRTRLLLIDQVTSPSGFRQPVERLVAEMNRRGIDTLVDGSHSIGMIPLDLDSLNATFFTSNCHKWLCTPKGSAFLHVRADHAESVYPMVISHGYNWRVPNSPKLHDLFDWPATNDFTPWLCVGETIDWFENLLDDHGTKLSKLANHNRELVLAARDLLCNEFGTDPVCPDDMITSLAAVSLPDEKTPPTLEFHHSAAALHPLHVRLRDEFRIEVPVFNWRCYPHLTVRVAAQLYNDFSQYERLAAALKKIIVI